MSNKRIIFAVGVVVKRRPSVFLWMFDHSCSLWIQIDVVHHLEKIRLSFNDRRFETIHNELSPTVHNFVIESGEESIDDSKEVRKIFFIVNITSNMGVIGHETVGKNLNVIFVFVFEQKVVIFFLGPIMLEVKITVVTLPSDME